MSRLLCAKRLSFCTVNYGCYYWACLLVPMITAVFYAKKQKKIRCMTKKNHLGFTLIELLVVVLIIGILAAVAVPQYKKAVEKTRITKILAIGRAIQQAEESYYMANGKYTDTLTDLDINITIPPEYAFQMYAESAQKIQFNRNSGNYVYEILFNLEQRNDNETIYCFAAKTAPKQSIELCKSLGEEIPNSDGHYRNAIGH